MTRLVCQRWTGGAAADSVCRALPKRTEAVKQNLAFMYVFLLPVSEKSATMKKLLVSRFFRRREPVTRGLLNSRGTVAAKLDSFQGLLNLRLLAGFDEMVSVTGLTEDPGNEPGIVET